MATETPPAPPDELTLLRERLATYERALADREHTIATLRDEAVALQTALDALPYAVYWKDCDLVYRGCNQRFARDVALLPDAIIGKTDAELPWRAEEIAAFQATDQRVMRADAPECDSDETTIHADGTQEWFETHKIPLRGSDQRVNGILATYINITGRKVAEATVRRQAELLLTLSTPLIPLTDEVLVLPLVGAIDSRRAQQIIEAVLTSVGEQGARVAIIDITGVPMVDTSTAHALIKTAQAVKLLGAQVVLTGIRPEVAQTLVHLGISLEQMVTRSTLQSGIAYALGQQRAGYSLL